MHFLILLLTLTHISVYASETICAPQEEACLILPTEVSSTKKQFFYSESLLLVIDLLPTPHELEEINKTNSLENISIESIHSRQIALQQLRTIARVFLQNNQLATSLKPPQLEVTGKK